MATFACLIGLVGSIGFVWRRRGDQSVVASIRFVDG
jgi:hypothetical protein